MYVHVGNIHMPVCACRRCWVSPSIIPFLILWGRVSSSTWSLRCLTLEAGKPPPVAILLRAGVTDKQQTLGLLGWCRGLNSGPRDFAASNFNHSAVCLLPFFPPFICIQTFGSLRRVRQPGSQVIQAEVTKKTWQDLELPSRQISGHACQGMSL